MANQRKQNFLVSEQLRYLFHQIYEETRLVVTNLWRRGAAGCGTISPVSNCD